MAEYQPSPEQEEIISEVNGRFQRWRQFRQPHETQWFVTSAFLHDQQYVNWSDRDARLTVPPAPAHRVRLTVNRMQAKVRARRAKFLKNRPIPVVIPASTEYEDQLDARASQKAIEYQWDRLQLERKYRDALMWGERCGKGYWWFYWDPDVPARVKTEVGIEEATLGDIGIEVGSPFEILVADPKGHSLALQPEIMRVKMRHIDEVKHRYPELADFITADTSHEEAFRYEQQIANLNAAAAFPGAGSLEEVRQGKGGEATMVTVKEHFIRPNAKHPNGAYRVVAGNVLLVARDELPYGFTDMDNPFPVVEFTDLETVGQYFAPTLAQYMISLQREYNLVRSKVAEQFRIAAFPKLLAARQHNIPKGAWTSEAGEFVEYLALPGIPPPTTWAPSGIASDAWRILDLITREFDDITLIYPAAEGKVAGATSGFQTNLLQEATDLVHSPDVRAHELAHQEAAQKIRRMMKLGYDVPRLLTVIGRNYAAEVIEFSQNEIDEYAKVRIQIGSQLPDLKAARIQSVVELFKTGIMGDIKLPDVQRKALTLLEMGSVEEAIDFAKADEDAAKLENNDIREGRAVEAAQFYENHKIHYDVHTHQLKSAEVRDWPPEQRMALITHVISHVAFINPMSAQMLAVQYGLIPPPQPTAQPGLGAPAIPAGPEPMGVGAASQPAPVDSGQAQGPWTPSTTSQMSSDSPTLQ